MQSFTTEDLLQYLYKETSPEKTLSIKTALEIDWNLREKYEVIYNSYKKLQSVNMSPRQKTVDFILHYAEKSVEEFTTHA